jgi:uncharacterized 2Fe-2S/4Fe-4S cluster protein (DUF4445 family)
MAKKLKRQVFHSVQRKGEWKVTAAVHHERGGPVVIALWPGLHNFACGLAVDIGSTTIACHLSSLLSGRTLASAGAPNLQIRFGEDLMSRVSYVMMNPDGREGMTKAVREAIGVRHVRMLSARICHGKQLQELPDFRAFCENFATRA